MVKYYGYCKMLKIQEDHEENASGLVSMRVNLQGIKTFSRRIGHRTTFIET